jgi:hypothetical protein
MNTSFGKFILKVQNIAYPREKNLPLQYIVIFEKDPLPGKK